MDVAETVEALETVRTVETIRNVEAFRSEEAEWVESEAAPDALQSKARIGRFLSSAFADATDSEQAGGDAHGGERDVKHRSAAMEFRSRYKQMKSSVSEGSYGDAQPSSGDEEAGASSRSTRRAGLGRLAMASLAGHVLAEAVDAAPSATSATEGSAAPGSAARGVLAMASLAGQSLMAAMEAETSPTDSAAPPASRGFGAATPVCSEGTPHSTTPLGTSSTMGASIASTMATTTMVHRGDPPGFGSTRSPSGDELQAETSFVGLTHRQAVWDRELESVDQKQAELLTMQWKLVREQTGTLAREIAVIQKHLKELAKDSRASLLETEAGLQRGITRLGEEHAAHVATCEGLEERLARRLRREIEAEAAQRGEGDQEVWRKLQALAEDVTEALDCRAKQQAALEQEVRQLRESCIASTQEAHELREALEQEVGERRASEDAMVARFRELREEFLQDERERSLRDKELLQALHDKIEQEKADRGLGHGSLHERCSALERSLQPSRDEMPALRGRLEELEGLLHSRLQDHRAGVDHELGERAAAHSRLDRRVSDVYAALEREAAARAAHAEETQQVLKLHQSKVKSLVTEHSTEVARHAMEELQDALHERLSRESAARAAQQEAANAQLSGQRTALGARLDALEEAFSSHRDERDVEARNLKAGQTKLTEELLRQTREVRTAFEASLAEERQCRDSRHSMIEERLDLVDRVLQDIRGVFLQRVPSRAPPMIKSLGTPRGTPVKMRGAPGGA
mmetsp:Transcript_113015/g.319729  ORF Transcript_113015/g.319729 Transcript_113015/m.319729 type:complete len:748 (+) Transcript_113015:74-2317(+)